VSILWLTLVLPLLTPIPSSVVQVSTDLTWSFTSMLTSRVGIGVNATYESLLASGCNSCEINPDKSAYWTPMLYYQHANGSFEEVPHGGSVIYYLGRGLLQDDFQVFTPFPKGFKMLFGNKAIRACNQTGMT